MTSYKVGQVIDNFKNREEGVIFDLADDCATLLVFFADPTQEEISQFKNESRFEIKSIEICGILIMTVKIGNLNWMDVPYSPHLSKNLTNLKAIGDSQGLALTIMLIDTVTGEIKHIRLIGLSNMFSKQLFDIIKKQKIKKFDTIEYNNVLNRIYSVYSTEQIVNMSNNYCRIN